MARPTSTLPRIVVFALGAVGLVTVSVVAYAVRGGERDESATTPSGSGEPAHLMPSTTEGPRVASQGLAPSMASSPVVVEAPGPVADPATAVTVALRGEDDVAKIAAVQAAVDRGAVKALPALLATDLAREPEAAPTIIHGVAKLAKEAAPGERAVAAKTLAKWLAEETKRHEPDAEGNVPNLVEALSSVGGPEARAALAETLRDGKVDLSVQTLIAQELGKSADPAQMTAARAFLARVAAMPQADGIDEELRKEAIEAANQAIRSMDPGGTK
jgi:hypothetical protein